MQACKPALLAVALLAPLAAAPAAKAALIAEGSSISLNGTNTFSATSITFTPTANVGGTSGSFNVLGVCVACATMINTLSTATALPAQLFTATNNGVTATLTASTANFNYTPGGIAKLDISGIGTMTLTGFDATSGQYIITTQGPGSTAVTFSATAIAVPEPATIGLFGIGLLGLAGIQYMRRRAPQHRDAA